MESSKHFYHYLVIFSLLHFLPVILVTSQNISAGQHGFSVKLIDPLSPLSPLSPFFNSNLTDTEGFNRILESDRRRLHHLVSLHNVGSANYSNIDPSNIRPGLSSKDLYYMVETGIGTGTGFENYYLHLDTGSSLSWIQCEPCHKCFRQQPRLFNPQNSPSYGALTGNDPYCRAPFYKPGPDGLCYFSIFYGDDTSANGTLASEIFTFTASQGASVNVPNVVFGCTHQTDTGYPLNGPVGIFGMDIEPESFISQPTSNPVTGSQFSYCLVEPGSTTTMALLFGDDITWPPVARIQETQILRFNNGFALYYVNLTDISIDNTRIYFPPGTFDRDPSGRRGFIIDSGAHYTYLPKLAYQIVRNALVLHFETLHLLPVEGRFDLCFNLPPNEDPVNLLPSMTFHFAGADLPLFYQQVFYVDVQQFCLAMFPENTGLAPGILGAFQQVNTQFEFDMRTGGILHMATVDCTHGV